MENRSPDLKCLGERIEKLEAQNRLMKRIGTVALALTSAVVAMGQIQTNKVIEANGFRMKDASGHLRAELLTNDLGQTMLELKDSTGKVTASLGTVTKGASLGLANLETGQTALFTAGSGLVDNLEIHRSTGSLTVSLDEAGGGPSIKIADKEGYSSVLGRSDLVVIGTGKKVQTPAASLILFDKNNKVLWSAP